MWSRYRNREWYMGARGYEISLRVFNSISHEWAQLTALLYQRLANKKSLSLFTFQKENPLLFIRGAKEREWCVISWLAISNTREKLSESFFSGGDKLFPVCIIKRVKSENIQIKKISLKSLWLCLSPVILTKFALLWSGDVCNLLKWSLS